MTMLMLQPFATNALSTVHSGILAAAATGQSASPYLVIAVLVAVGAIVALAKLLRGLLQMVAPLISSAGAVLVTLIGVGVLLFTTVLTVFTTR
jgi:predicted tellurium resistance membrane protein TerC